MPSASPSSSPSCYCYFAVAYSAPLLPNSLPRREGDLPARPFEDSSFLFPSSVAPAAAAEGVASRSCPLDLTPAPPWAPPLRSSSESYLPSSSEELSSVLPSASSCAPSPTKGRVGWGPPLAPTPALAPPLSFPFALGALPRMAASHLEGWAVALHSLSFLSEVKLLRVYFQ